jgi:hypothetical protein
MITIYLNILDKLEAYLINNLGFKCKNHILSKELTKEEFMISPVVLNNIVFRRAFSFKPIEAVLEDVLVENYVSDIIMNKALEEIEWTPEERAFFTCQNDSEEEENRAYQCWAEIESWVCLQKITVNPKDLKQCIKDAKNGNKKGK